MAGTGRQGEEPAWIDPGPVVPEAVVFMAWMGSGLTCCFYRGTIACCNQLLLYCSLLCSGSHLGFYCSDIQIRASIQTLQNGVPPKQSLTVWFIQADERVSLQSIKRVALNPVWLFAWQTNGAWSQCLHMVLLFEMAVIKYIRYTFWCSASRCFIFFFFEPTLD